MSYFFVNFMKMAKMLFKLTEPTHYNEKYTKFIMHPII